MLVTGFQWKKMVPTSVAAQPHQKYKLSVMMTQKSVRRISKI